MQFINLESYSLISTIVHFTSLVLSRYGFRNWGHMTLWCRTWDLKFAVWLVPSSQWSQRQFPINTPPQRQYDFPTHPVRNQHSWEKMGFHILNVEATVLDTAYRFGHRRLWLSATICFTHWHQLTQLCTYLHKYNLTWKPPVHDFYCNFLKYIRIRENKKNK